MHSPPDAPRPAPTSPQPRPRLMALVGLGIPLALLVGCTLAPPAWGPRLWGISPAIWWLFAAAPLTSLCLLACQRLARTR